MLVVACFEFFHINFWVRVCAYMWAWPCARALVHLGVGLVLGVWGVGAGRCVGVRFQVFNFLSF